MDTFIKKHLEAAQTTVSLYANPASTRYNTIGQISTSNTTVQGESNEENKSNTSNHDEKNISNCVVIRHECLEDIEKRVELPGKLVGLNVQTGELKAVILSAEQVNFILRLDIEDEYRLRGELIQLLKSPAPSAQRIVQLTAAYLHCALRTSYACFQTIKSTDTEKGQKLMVKIEQDMKLKNNLKLLVNPNQDPETVESAKQIMDKAERDINLNLLGEPRPNTVNPNQNPAIKPSKDPEPRPNTIKPSQNPETIEYLETLRVVMMQRAIGRHRVAELKPPLNEFYKQVYWEMLEKDIDTIVRGEPFRGYSCMYSIPDFNWLISTPRLDHTRTRFEDAIDSELAKRAKYDLDIPLVCRFRDILKRMVDEFVYLEGLQLWKRDLAEGRGDKERVLERIAIMEPHEVKFDDLEKEATILYVHFLSLQSPFYRALTTWTPRQIFSTKHFIQRLVNLCDSVCH